MAGDVIVGIRIVYAWNSGSSNYKTFRDVCRRDWGEEGGKRGGRGGKRGEGRVMYRSLYTRPSFGPRSIKSHSASRQ